VAQALQVVTSFLEAVKEMSHAKAFPLLDSMIQWDQPGNNRFSGVKKGTNEVFGMFKGFLNMSASTLRLTEIKVLAVNGNQVACHLHWSATQPPGSILDVDNIDVYTVENGKILKAVVYSANINSEDRFWLK
jgi:ketosteroid isomerase-like protein